MWLNIAFTLIGLGIPVLIGWAVKGFFMDSGEITEYTKMMAEAREEAIQRMVEDAEGASKRGFAPLHILLPPLSREGFILKVHPEGDKGGGLLDK